MKADALAAVRDVVGTASDMAMLLAQLERHGEATARAALDVVARAAYPNHQFPVYPERTKR